MHIRGVRQYFFKTLKLKSNSDNNILISEFVAKRKISFQKIYELKASSDKKIYARIAIENGHYYRLCLIIVQQSNIPYFNSTHLNFNSGMLSNISPGKGG